MHHRRLAIPEVILIEFERFKDERGFFSVTFNEAQFCETIGKSIRFVQDNHSGSVRNVIRGLHYQVENPQGKLIRVVTGAVFDVAVDLRSNSPTYGRWVGELLTAKNNRQLWIPEGFAHGFMAVSEFAELCYKVTTFWSPAHERCILWNDPSLAISWPLSGPALLSEKDRCGEKFATATALR